MAHEITQRENGMSEMAFTGPRSAVWHGLGQHLQEDATIEQWREQAGMDWEVLESPVSYVAMNDQMQPETKVFPDRKIVFRSDTKEALGMVGDKFKVVQPAQVLEFFRDLVDIHGFKLSTAGTLFGGKKFWALADVGKTGNVTDGDRIDGHLLLTTACDGSMSTQARFTSTRVVCNNTLTLALNSKSSKPIVRITHKRDFDPEAVKFDLGVLDEAWLNFMKTMRKLSNTKMSAQKTREFYEKQIFDPTVAAHEQGWGKIREVERLTDLALYGSGSDMTAGTAYGALCGITEYYTHGNSKRDPSHQFWSAYVGDHQKMDMYNALLREVA